MQDSLQDSDYLYKGACTFLRNKHPSWKQEILNAVFGENITGKSLLATQLQDYKVKKDSLI